MYRKTLTGAIFNSNVGLIGEEILFLYRKLRVIYRNLYMISSQAVGSRDFIVH
jgi:hypothetical protein